MKIGMNDPCPCGSGKKYKKCCRIKEYNLKKAKEKFETFYSCFKSDEQLKPMSIFDKLYASLKNYNNRLLAKANLPQYIGANFYDAIDLSITSNALSLIKGIFQENNYSITNALNLRNLIECFTLLSMDEKGDISDTQKMLFVEQYKLIEYESYAKGDSNEYESMLDINDLRTRYDSGKAKFLEVLGTEKKLKRIINSRLPFLCDEKLNYNKLIEKYCPQFLQPYIYLSRMVHPSSYDSFRNIEFHKSIYWLIMILVAKRYKDKPYTATDLTYYKEQAFIYCFGVDFDDNYGKKLNDIQNRQCQILKKISDEFKKVYGEESYVKNFLDELAMIVRDINTDSQLGYTENVKLKFKVIAEMFACFHRVYSADVDSISYFYDMLRWHDIIKGREQFEAEITDDDKNKVYERYLEKYPSSKLTRDELFKEYDKPLGFLVDEEGNSPNFAQIVEEYLEKLYQNFPMANKKIKIKDYYRIVYKESNNMSHGCGYLFFANIGAWMDDVNVVHFLDNSIRYFLHYVGKLFTVYAEDSEDNKIAGLIKESLIEMNELIANKKDILRKIERINKNF